MWVVRSQRSGFFCALRAAVWEVACSGPYFEKTKVSKVFIANDWPCGWRSWRMACAINYSAQPAFALVFDCGAPF